VDGTNAKVVRLQRVGTIVDEHGSSEAVLCFGGEVEGATTARIDDAQVCTSGDECFETRARAAL
jgi:hypothetical protein